MKLSKFGKKVIKSSGIKILMDDLGEALFVNKDMLMLGGGNPAHIPQMQRYFRETMLNILQSGRTFEECIGNYDTPQGKPEFLEAIAELLKENFKWPVTAENIALTNGSQSAFFVLFNMFAGEFDDGTIKKILFPLAPEYIGYSDVGLNATDNIFTAVKPIITELDPPFFKYHIDFDNLNITDDIGAICVSRPTNPTGNVLTDTEIERLIEISEQNDLPLIIDNAYGTPFPNIIFTDAKPYYGDNVIVCMSLSKLGLPGLRTGIIVARTEIINAMSEMAAVMNLAPISIGATMAMQMVRTGEIISLSKEIVQPYYREKANHAVDLVIKHLKGTNFRIHKPEGALFLWLWFPDMPITSQQLYERLKKRGVLVIPGQYFFPGLTEEWPHKDQCIRMTYSQDDEIVARGIEIIAEEVKNAYAE
jgi:valine--pyruvate aminotransferase